MRRVLLIALLIAASATALQADYRESYRRAIQARNRGRWDDVARLMREAIAEEAKEKGGVKVGERINISGMDFMPYMPHFYLGLALATLDDCAGAVDAWRIAEERGSARFVSDNERGAFKKLRGVCDTRLASARPTPGPPPGGIPKPAGPDKPVVPEKPAGPDPAAVNAAAQTAEGAIGRAESSERAVTQLASDALLGKVWKSEASLGAAEQRARDTLGRARNELDAGRREPNVKRLQDAAALATTALQSFDAIRQSAQARRDELQRAAIAESKPKPLREEKPGVVTPPTKTDPPATTVPTPQPFTPPPALAAAARLYFNARYQDAAASLGELRYPDGLAAGHTALLRAASQYALYLVGGERDAQLLNQARQSVAEARRVAPSLQPDARAFSPRFVQFYASVK